MPQSEPKKSFSFDQPGNYRIRIRDFLDESWSERLGDMHAFRGEKGLTTEGGFRVPQLARWPGHIKPGTIINDITSHIDWMPTLLAAANGGEDTGIQEKLKKGGFKADGKTFKAHLDGYNQLDLLTGKIPKGKGPRQEIYYFDADGGLNAVRWRKWKITFTEMSGSLPEVWKKSPSWPIITNLRLDPYERWQDQSQMYLHWFGKLFDIEIASIPVELAQDIAKRIGDAADMGDVRMLNAIAEEIKDQSDSCVPLSKQIVQLAEHFDLNGIQKLADSLAAG